MFKDRAAQFKDRLDWDVTVDENGWEVDEYDRLNPLYIIWENAEGRHGGSVRIMPTVGRTMTNEHFLDLTGGVRIRSPLIWECTRFCLAPDAPAGVAAALLAAGVELGLRFGLEQAVGRDLRQDDAAIYRPHRLRPGHHRQPRRGPRRGSASGSGRSRVEARAEISRRSGIPLSVIARWFDASFPARVAEERLAA